MAASAGSGTAEKRCGKGKGKMGVVETAMYVESIFPTMRPADM